MKMKGKILVLSISSILITGIIALTISLLQLSSALAEESEEGLKTTALASLNIYSVQGYGDYSLKEDGNVWRGMNFNVSESTNIVDDIKEESDIDITFFFGDIVAMTSLMDKEGNQSEKVIKTEEIFDSIKNITEVSHSNADIIENNTTELNSVKNSMVQIVNQLSDIAQNNAASAQETSAITQEVTRTVAEVANSASKLKEVVNNLEKNIELFKL